MVRFWGGGIICGKICVINYIVDFIVLELENILKFI